MRFADILVCIDGSRGGRQRLRVALELGARSGGPRIIACYLWPTQGTVPFVEEPTDILGSPAGPEVAVAAADVAEEMHADFERQLKLKDLEGDWILGRQAADLSDVMDYSRCVDLVVAGLTSVPGYPDDPSGIDVEALVVGAGRPVLGVPVVNVPDKIGSNIVVAWDGSREATRALHDALPFLLEAKSVKIVSVGGDERSPQSPANLAAHLLRLGISATIDDATLSMDSTGEEILSRLQQPTEPDLLVAGAFGHSRIQERFIGGASRTFLHQMLIPVLVSH